MASGSSWLTCMKPFDSSSGDQNETLKLFMTLQVPYSECIFLLIRSNGESVCEGDGEGHGVSGLLILHACHPFTLLTTTDATDITLHTYLLISDVMIY